MLVKNGLEVWACQTLLFGWTQWVKGSAGGSTVEGGRPERERHHWLLRGGRHWEAAACTNCVIAARARTICVGSERNKNRLHTNRN